MSSIDQRVVQMKFDNAAFQSGVAGTLRSLEALNKGMKLTGATKGLTDITAASQKVSLKNIEHGVEAVASKFKALGVVAVASLATITTQAVASAQHFLKSFTVEPILAGFREYETNLNSIQTILANTGLEGAKGLKTVTAALDELNHYSDQTIYNFSEMARNIGTFTAAGVKLNVATAAIKGIANLAAVSGSSSEQASAAMYQLSQAISEGKVSLESWNSVVNAGMGGKVFQNSLVETARVHGVAVDKMIKDEGSFRLSLQKGWLTSDILTETLSKFTGDLNAKQLKTMGYNDQQIAGILKMGKTAQDAATKVKTMSQLINTLQEAAGSGWAKTWQTIFGDFNEAKTLFTDVNNVLGGFITASANARNKVLGDWKALGGRKVIIDSISNAFHALIAVLKPIKDAFREIFPAVTGKQLYEMSLAIRDFTASLMISGTTANNLKRTFAGVFAVLGIGWEIIKQVAKTLLTLFGVATEGSGGFLAVTASIGDFLVGLHKAIAEGEGLTKFFSGLGRILSIPIKLLKAIAGYFGSLFKDLDSSDATKAIESVTKRLAPFGKLGELVAKVWGKVIGVLGNVWSSFQSIGSKISTFFGGFGEQIANALTGLDFGDVLAAFNTGLFAGLVLLVKKFVGKGGGITGIFDNIGEAFENLTGALSAMQNTLRAATLLQIALAVGILAVSMNVLAKIDAAGLTRASAAITVMFTQLIGALLLFEKFSGFKGMAKMPFVAASLILLGVAINVLALAVKQLAGLSWEELAKGLTGVTVLLAAVITTVKLMPNPALTIASAAGLVILAAAIKVLASSVTDLSGLSWSEMARGLIGVGALLAGLTLFSKFATANATGLLGGAGIVLLAAGIKILASAVKDMAGMSWPEIARGLVTLAGALGVITAALAIIPPSAIVSAAGVLIVALSLGKIADALGQLGSMSWGSILKGLTAMFGAFAIIAAGMIAMTEALPGAAALLVVALSLGKVAEALGVMGAMSWSAIGKSMVVLFGSLLLISAAMIAMTEALPGAAALLVVAAALAVLAPVLVTLGNMSWSEIGKGLLVLAAAFVIIGAAGVVLAPVVPVLLGLGAAIVLLGAGAALAGVGILALSVGLAALAISGAAGTAALVAMVAALIGLIPAAMKAIGQGLVLFAGVIATAGPAITKALVTVLDSLITAVAKLTPKIVNALYKMLTQLLATMNKYVPNLTEAGMRLITGILNGIAKRIGGIVTAATSVVVAFINGVSNNLPRVIQAGVNLVIKFVNGVANAIRSNSSAMGAAGANLGSAIVEGMVRGIAGGIGAIASKAREVAASALAAAKSVLGIHSPSKEFQKVGKYVVDGFRKGLDGSKSQIDSAFNSMKAQLLALSKSAKASGAERKKAAQAYGVITKSLGDEHTALGKLATKYDDLTKKITAANETYANAIKTRDDYNTSLKDQYSTLVTADSEDTAATYIGDLQKQLDDTKSFMNTLQQLRKLGLNDVTYKQLLATGTSALPFVEDLLKSGKTSIDQINTLDKQISDVASSLGQTASSQLYQAAVDSAKGLVDGLKKQQAAIEAQMDKIADAMVKAIKKKLGIKSPSKVFAKLGGFSSEGLAKGLEQSSAIVEKSASNVGGNAINALRKSLAVASKMSISEVDLNPTITPVLDLTQVKKDASELSSLVPTVASISVDGAYKNAVAASAAVRASQTTDDPTDSTSDSSVSFTQNNYSPKALTPAEIYRQTKNQLSKAKEALAT